MVYCKCILKILAIIILLSEKIRNLEFVQDTRVKVEFDKLGYKSNKIIRLDAKVE